MSDLTGGASRWLQGMRARHLQVEVRYSRGGAEATVGAALGRTDARAIESDAGPVIEDGSEDFLILAVDLADAGFGEPVRGDRIKTADGTTFEVMPQSGGTAWRWSDRNRITYRVHTREVQQ